MGRKQNFEILLSLLPSSFAFPPSIFFLLQGIYWFRFGKKCRFRIFGLDQGESVGIRFSCNSMGIFGQRSTSSPESCSFWYGVKKLFPIHK